MFAVALVAAWWMWNYYMQTPWTRDGKVRAEQVSITPQVSGTITMLAVKDNQLVKAGQLLFRIDDTPYHIAVLNAEAQLAKAQTDLAKASNEANRRRHLSQNYISAEDLDTANIGAPQRECGRRHSKSRTGNARSGALEPAADHRQRAGGWLGHESFGAHRQLRHRRTASLRPCR